MQLLFSTRRGYFRAPSDIWCLLEERKETTEEKMVKEERFTKALWFIGPFLREGWASLAHTHPSLRRGYGEGHTLILGTFTTVPKIHEKGKHLGHSVVVALFFKGLGFFRLFFFFSPPTKGIKSEYQNSLRIYIHHIVVKHTPILKSRLTVLAFVKWLELG